MSYIKCLKSVLLCRNKLEIQGVLFYNEDMWGFHQACVVLMGRPALFAQLVSIVFRFVARSLSSDNPGLGGGTARRLRRLAVCARDVG